MNKQKVEVGKRIAEVRKAKKIKQEELKELIGAPTVQMISGWENGHSFPSVIYLKKIAETLDTSLDYLLCGINKDAKDTTIKTYKDVVVYMVEMVNSGLFQISDGYTGYDKNGNKKDQRVCLQTYDKVLCKFKEEFDLLLNAKDTLGPDLYLQAVKSLLNKYDRPLNNK